MDEKEEKGEVEPVEFHPSNSVTKKSDDDAKPKKVMQVTKGTIIKKKRSFVESFSEAFFGDSSRNVVNSVIWDVLVPAAKNTISDMISTGIEMLLFGEPRSGGRSLRRDKDKSYVSYQSYYDRDDRGRSVRERGRTRVPARTHQFDDILLETRVDAQTVLGNLVDLVENYGMVSVAEYYDLVGEPSEFVDQKWGWYNLHLAEVRRVRDGYIVILPKPVLLE